MQCLRSTVDRKIMEISIFWAISLKWNPNDHECQRTFIESWKVRYIAKNLKERNSDDVKWYEVPTEQDYHSFATTKFLTFQTNLHRKFQAHYQHYYRKKWHFIQYIVVSICIFQPWLLSMHWHFSPVPSQLLYSENYTRPDNLDIK